MKETLTRQGLHVRDVYVGVTKASSPMFCVNADAAVGRNFPRYVKIDVDKDSTETVVVVKVSWTPDAVGRTFAEFSNFCSVPGVEWRATPVSGGPSA